MAGKAPPRKGPPSPNGAPTLTPLGHYAGRPDIAISRQITVIGSKAGSRLHLASSTVSQSHAIIVNSAAGPYIRDLASRTNVLVNGKPKREADLSDGALLQIGKFKFQFNEGVTNTGLQLGRSTPVGEFDPAPGAVLHVEGGEMPVPIEERTVLIGRRPTSDIPLIEESVSTAHAVIFEMNGKRYIRDLNSRTGTFVNDQKVEQVELKFGDQIRIGETNIGYASASGQVAEREVDELDHLVSTAPLGTAALEPPDLADEAVDDDHHGTAAGHAIPVQSDESNDDEGRIPVGEPAPREAPPEDQVRLDADPDVGGAGPADTAVLPPQREAEAKPRKIPTLKARLVEEPDPAAAAAAPAAPAESVSDEADIDDALGLTPEARRREEAKAEDLGGSRRGWRGMAGDETGIPLTEHAAEAPAPAPHPELEPEAETEPEPEPEAEAEAEAEAEIPAEVQATPQVEPQPQPEAEPEPTPAPAAEAAQTRDQAEAEEPQDTTVQAVAEGLPEEPPAPQVAIDEEVTDAAADTLPAETFDLDITEDVSPPLASAEHESAEQLHLPPVVDETDEFDIEPLPLTPEEGAPLDLSVEETPEPIDRPAPPLKLEEPPAREPEPQPAPEPVAEQKPKRKRAPRKKKGDVEAEPVVEAAVEPAPEPAPEPEPAAEAPAARDSVEVVDQTQPTPESALDIEDAVADMLAEPLPLDESPPAAADMTDTGFGRAVDAFVGESTGPLVEEREEPGASLAKAPAKAEPVEQTPEPVAEAAEEPKAVEEAPQAPSLDDLIADVLGPDVPGADVPGKAHAPSLDAQGDDLAMEELALEELGLPAEATAKAKPVAEPEPVAEAQAEEVEVESEPEPQPQSVAQSPQDQEPSPTPEAQEVPSAARPMVAPPGFGPNQEHFLGGMPLKLNKPVKPAGLTDTPGAAAAAARAPNRASLMPAPPPRATRPNARTRNPFDIAPNDLHTEDLGASIPPYRGNAPKAGQITTGFDGLAMPPVRQTDVFSQMSTPASFVAGLAGGMADDDIFSRGAKHHSPEPQQAAPARKTAEPSIDASAQAVNEGMHDTEVGSPADAVWSDDAAHNDAASDETAGESVGAAGAPPARPRPLPAPPAFGPDGQPAVPAPKRKRRWFGLRMLLVLMLLLSAATAGGIYGFVKRQTNVVGKLRFDNVDALKTIEQSNLLNEQKKLASDQAVREAARKLLAERNPTIAPGFLAAPVAFERAAQRADWAADQKGAFAFPYVGNDEQGDPQRVRAVMLALYDANTKHVGAAGSIHASIKSLTDAHAKSQQRVNDLKAQIERLNVVAQQMPERKHLDELTAEVARLDQAYTDARRKAKDINDDLERMRQSLPANPQPAGTAQAPVVDPELSKMQEELDATNKRLGDTKAQRAKASEAAQVALDAALGQFEKEIAGAQDIAKDNPELSAYVTAAQKLQTSTRELTEQLIRRQQQQQQQLGELKTRLSEKMEARRADAWKKDPKLQEYGDQLAIVQRQYNAAMGGGARKEAEEFKAQMEMLDKMIKARQTLVGDDAFYADAIEQLQKMIDSSQRSLDDDRKHTEAVLEDMQAAFTKSQPAVEKMPAAQKELAASLEKQLAGVNAARKQYTQAADAAAAAGDEQVKQAQAAAATLAAKIETRRKELASQAEKAATAEQEQNRLAAVKQRESQLVAAQAVELKARQEWDTAQRALREAETTQAEAREAGEKRDALAAERVDAQKNLDAALRKLELARAEAGHMVEPFPPTEADVQMTVHDPRPVYALASVGGIVAVFTLLILFTAGAPAPEPDEMKPGADFPAFAVRIPPTPQPNGNGIGSPAAQHLAHPADEESPRVAV